MAIRQHLKGFEGKQNMERQNIRCKIHAYGHHLFASPSPPSFPPPSLPSSLPSSPAAGIFSIAVVEGGRKEREGEGEVGSGDMRG